MAQQRLVVVDQTGLPLPGAHVDVRRGDQVVVSLDTGQDGGFDLPALQPDDVIEISLDGFETQKVPASSHGERVILALARATETTEVVASALTSAGASMQHLGSTMTAPLAQRLPTARPRILQSLPLLPGVVRGRDGQLRIGGTRPHESSLWIDGFDVTDPMSGTVGIDLPVESVRGMAVLREPVPAEFRDMLGSAASIETTPGPDTFMAGIQGFIPRPRLSSYGLGRIEAFFPRAYVGGRAGKMRYFASTEFAFERVAVAGVTGQSGTPNVGTTGVTTFARIDYQHSTKHSLTVEGLFAPVTTTDSGLSTLRPEGTVPDADVSDAFIGITDRLVLSPRDLITIRVGATRHSTRLAAQGAGDALLTPAGWLQNWFSKVDVSGTRQNVSVTWERAGIVAKGAHTVSVNGGVRRRSMDGTVTDENIRVLDSDGNTVRYIQFGPSGELATTEYYGGGGVRDLWDITERLQLDMGVRVDGGAAAGRLEPAPRFGFRYFVDKDARTTLRGSVGRYVGRVPLAGKAFSSFPARTDMTFDPDSGRMMRRLLYVPTLSDLPLPHADAVAIEVEHKLTPSLEVQTSVRHRRGSELPTVGVPLTGGLATLDGVGVSTYRELQFAVRKVWQNESQVFVSYVFAKSTGETNDFGTLFTNLDAPLLEPGASAVINADVPHRLRGWATFSLPEQIVVSPAVEWRTGFPYSALNVYQHYAEAPNSQRFPAYFSTDVTAFKTFDLFGQKMDLGLQFFNITSHENPRDVIAVVDSPRYGEYAATFGITLAGYMQVRW
jgi:hypothetical protein